ncbi:MAG TPA: NAD(P)-dependent oxidoreductase [Thermomicrobiales bacterium]|nr:NAD(P)-dependent oxidoreductase [Thermomicrobiales bacterium]
MTTLVTGGNGWVPSHIVRRLARRGETVVSFDLMPPDEPLREMLGDAMERVLFEPGDVTDRDALRTAAARHGVTSIVHAAAITPRIDRERREPTRIVDVNLGGTVNALEVARNLPDFRRFVYVSSCAVWGAQPGATTIDEDSPANTTNLYGITKLASERTALRYGELFDMDVVALRPGNVYGPMERPTPGYAGATQPREMLRIHFAGQPVLVNSLAGPHLDWTYVEDIAEGIERAWAFAGPPPHRVYSLTCGQLHSIGDLLAAFARYLPGFTYQVVPAEEANYRVSGDEPGGVPSNARVRADFGWAPATPFEDGMRAYCAWIQAHGPQ